MRTRFLPLALALLLTACQGNSSTMTDDGPIETKAPAAPMLAPSVILVNDFTMASTQMDDGQMRLLPALRSLRSELSDSQLINRIPGALVSELKSRGFAAELHSGTAYPPSGWVVQGAFLQEEASGGALARRFEHQPVEVVVSVQDLVRGTPTTLANLNVEGARSGEGVPVVPNPYAAAAKFVLRQAELSGDANKLAARIADEIVRFAQSPDVKR
jgi:hypothetical protein